MNLSFFHTYISPSAETKVKEVLKSGMLSEGAVTQEFEKALMATFGLDQLICLNSGTSALHLALDLIDVGPGDEVILPAQTFVATGLAVLYRGARPVFADIRYADGNIDSASVAEKIGPRTKAVLCVHWGGYPCEMDALVELCREKSLFLIEDAAHALGASYKGRPIGKLSDITCFSFQAIKHLSTGDGGAIVVRDPELYQKAKRKKWFGIDREKAPLSPLGERQYNLEEIGYKYHLNNFASALGLANLEGYAQRLDKRRSLAAFYREALAKLKGIRLFEEQPDRESAYWLFGFHCDNREKLMAGLHSKAVPSSVVHQRIDRNHIFGGPFPDLKAQSRFDDSQLHIPIHDAIDLEMASYIVEAIKNSL